MLCASGCVRVFLCFVFGPVFLPLHPTRGSGFTACQCCVDCICSHLWRYCALFILFLCFVRCFSDDVSVDDCRKVLDVIGDVLSVCASCRDPDSKECVLSHTYTYVQMPAAVCCDVPSCSLLTAHCRPFQTAATSRVSGGGRHRLLSLRSQGRGPVRRAHSGRRPGRGARRRGAGRRGVGTPYGRHADAPQSAAVSRARRPHQLRRAVRPPGHPRR